MSEKKPTVQPSIARGKCPVCGRPSYSRAGTHPQCEMRRADLLHRVYRNGRSA